MAEFPGSPASSVDVIVQGPDLFVMCDFSRCKMLHVVALNASANSGAAAGKATTAGKMKRRLHAKAALRLAEVIISVVATKRLLRFYSAALPNFNHQGWCRRGEF